MDIFKMLKAAGEMKRRLPELQAKLANTRYTAQSGDGKVSATVNGKLALVDLQIDPQALREADAQRLTDMVREAISAAQQQATQAAADAMKEITGGMDLPEDLKGMF